MFQSVDLDEPLMWWTNGLAHAVPSELDLKQFVVNAWSWLFSQNASFVMRATIELWGYRACRILEDKSAPSVSTTQQSFLYSLHTDHFLLFGIWRHTDCLRQRPGGFAPPELPLSQQKCLFSSTDCWGWKHTDQVHLWWIKPKVGPPLHPRVCQELSSIRGELWNRGVQTPKRMNFWRTKALKAKTFSIWSLPWNYSGISTDFDNPRWSARLSLCSKEYTHTQIHISEERASKRERERQQVLLPSWWCHCGGCQAAESGAPWCSSLILCSFSCRMETDEDLCFIPKSATLLSWITARKTSMMLSMKKTKVNDLLTPLSSLAISRALQFPVAVFATL